MGSPALAVTSGRVTFPAPKGGRPELMLQHVLKKVFVTDPAMRPFVADLLEALPKIAAEDASAAAASR